MLKNLFEINEVYYLSKIPYQLIQELNDHFHYLQHIQ